ncbi:hypothetical protein [Corynebacterium sp. NML130628]|uniref:hypothetical protein n=1 Tax=Corynebacterium sp. NML130628 TaxID=1906333 RepID=UPI0008FB81FF|nr:hypothetical protein [Corynebacterium sp. NML130628]OIR45457.1 hypothetical protein BJP07_03575 [Corynebacterium sp. NML130628]
MRNFRTAAVASATALTVALGGVATASAAQTPSSPTPTATVTPTPTPKTKADQQGIFVGKQKGDKDAGKVIADGTKGLFSGLGSSQAFDKEEREKPFYITDAFGKETDIQALPQWARYWIDGTVVAGIGALVGLIIAGFNFASYNGLIKL